jgi:hypothetical protein
MSLPSEITRRRQEMAESALAPEPPSPGSQHPEIQVDDSRLVATYANFCRATGTPEELIVDFGLNPQPVGAASRPVVVTQRVTMNYYTAKRLCGALVMAVQRHENVFGTIETDIQKRVNRSMP